MVTDFDGVDDDLRHRVEAAHEDHGADDIGGQEGEGDRDPEQHEDDDHADQEPGDAVPLAQQFHQSDSEEPTWPV